MTPFAQLEHRTKQASLKMRAKAFGRGVLDPLDMLVTALRGKLGEVPDRVDGARRLGQGAAIGGAAGAVGEGIGGLLREAGVIDGKDKDLKKEASRAAGMKLLDRLRRAGKGALRAPGDAVGASSGFASGGMRGMSEMNECRGEGLKALNLGRAGDLGNLAGNIGIGGSGLVGGAMALNRLRPAEHGRDWRGVPLPSPAEQQRSAQDVLK